jgi:hypothetical protein
MGVQEKSKCKQYSGKKNTKDSFRSKKFIKVVFFVNKFFVLNKKKQQWKKGVCVLKKEAFDR